MTESGKKVALIIGITGQDGSYLAEFLLSNGYQVNGVMRRASTFNTGRIEHIYQDPHEKEYSFRLHYGDLSDASGLIRLLSEIRPDEVYNLGAQSHVKVSFEIPEYTADVDALGTLRLLEAIRFLKLPCKFYQGSSSEMFGSSPPPQSENTVFHPRSPYAVAKVFSHHCAVNYREAYGVFAVGGILFNHESPRRGETFVTRKITRGVAAIAAGRQQKIFLGNLEAKRDWGYAAEYVESMWKMLQQPQPEDFVIATGEMHTVREFAAETFRLVGMDYEKFVETDSRYLRPSEVEQLQGDPSKAAQKLGFAPKVRFKDLAAMMLIEDLKKEGMDPKKYGLPERHPLTAGYLGNVA